MNLWWTGAIGTSLHVRKWAQKLGIDSVSCVGFYKKAAAFVLRAVAKHSLPLAQAVSPPKP